MIHLHFLQKKVNKEFSVGALCLYSLLPWKLYRVRSQIFAGMIQSAVTTYTLFDMTIKSYLPSNDDF